MAALLQLILMRHLEGFTLLRNSLAGFWQMISLVWATGGSVGQSEDSLEAVDTNCSPVRGKDGGPPLKGSRKAICPSGVSQPCQMGGKGSQPHPHHWGAHCSQFPSFQADTPQLTSSYLAVTMSLVWDSKCLKDSSHFPSLPLQ